MCICYVIIYNMCIYIHRFYEESFGKSLLYKDFLSENPCYIYIN